MSGDEDTGNVPDNALPLAAAVTPKLRPTPTAHHQPTEPRPTRIPEELRTCPMVFIHRDGHRAPLSARYNGPYRVLAKEEKFFRLRLGDREDTVANDRLKPATLEQDTPPAQPPRRGRPPAQLPAQPPRRGPSPQPPRLPPARPPVSPTNREPSTTLQTPARRTRSGRTVRTPQRYVSMFGG